MMRSFIKERVLPCAAALFLAAMLFLPLLPGARAGGLPVYHQATGAHAPYEENATFVEQSPFAPDEALLEVDILGIRQGDCIVIRCGDQNMLIDGGEATRFNTLRAYMRETLLDGFDTMFLTHAHDDHIEVQQKLVAAEYRVGRVLSPYGAEDLSALWVDYRKELDKYGIPYEKIDDGDEIALGGATLTIFRDTSTVNANNRSAAAMLRFGEASMFLAADIGGYTQQLLLDRYGAAAFACDVYKVAHHGRTATEGAFLRALSPALAVITNTKESAASSEEQLNHHDIPRYYISTGTIHLQTNGKAWYVWQTPVTE